MKRIFVAYCLFIILAGGILSGCSSRATASEPLNGKDAIKEYDEMVELETLDKAYIEGQKDFAYGIFNALQDGENIFISPYSIATALSMLYNGADTGTREEMAQLFGYDLLPGYTPDHSEAANHYVNANNKLRMELMQAADPKVKINVANSIWLAQDGEFGDRLETVLLAPARYYYNGDIFSVDFTKEETLKEVNSWVSKKTEGMIDPFLDNFSDPELLRVFLANAVYFNGEWTLPFEPKDTREAPFYGEESKTSIEMMHLFKEKFRYYSEGGIQGVVLPYGDGRIVMDILIPEDKQQSIRDLTEGLPPEELDGFLHKLETSDEVKIDTLGIPKFELEYGLVNLNNALAGMGMEEAFLPEAADFELIGEQLYVSRVAHKAIIRVEEWGTEASAATGIEVDTTSAVMDPPLNFIADVPFLFFIRDTGTDTVLFMGSMNQPKH